MESMRQSLAMIELGRHNWETFGVADGRPRDVPEYLEGLIESQTKADAEGYYWGLENEVVIQGQLYNSAVPVVSVILAALADDSSSNVARSWLLELLLQIVSGESISDEISLGNPDLGDQCRAAASTGLWILYRELHKGDARAAKAVLDVLEPSGDRATAILAARNVQI
jgi:hypothetical protein